MYLAAASHENSWSFTLDARIHHSTLSDPKFWYLFPFQRLSFCCIVYSYIIEQFQPILQLKALLSLSLRVRSNSLLSFIQAVDVSFLMVTLSMMGEQHSSQSACPLCRRLRFGTHLEPLFGGSLTVHPAANWDPVEILGG